MSERRPARLAFTLFEVMAAVALLGFAVAMLARGAIAGMQYEGGASRRLRASLLADEKLWEQETNIRLGAPLQPDVQEGLDPTDEFHWVVEVAPVDPALLGLGALFAPEAAVSAPSSPARPAAPRPRAPAPTPNPKSGPLTLLQVNIRVTWTEGLTEQWVTRTTFAYDAQAAAGALAALKAGQALKEGQEQEQKPARSPAGADKGRRGRQGSRPPARATEEEE